MDHVSSEQPPAAPVPQDQAVTEFAAGLVGDIEQLQRHVARLERALELRPRIDQATGILMHRFAVDSDAALTMMTGWSAVTDINLADLAEAMVKLAADEPSLPPVTAGVARQVRALLRDQWTASSSHNPLGARSVTPAQRAIHSVDHAEPSA